MRESLGDNTNPHKVAALAGHDDDRQSFNESNRVSCGFRKFLVTLITLDSAASGKPRRIFLRLLDESSFAGGKADCLPVFSRVVSGFLAKVSALSGLRLARVLSVQLTPCLHHF